MIGPRDDQAAAPGDLEEYLRERGEIFRSFRLQDSGCIGFGVRVGDERYFVKGPTSERGRASLARAEALHARVEHPCIVPVLEAFACSGGRALVYPWVEGELLYHPAEGASGEEARNHPDSPHARFRSLPLEEVLAAYAELLAAHRVIAAAGFVAVDLYDGCFLYRFGRPGRMRLIDLDEYRPGPFVLEEDRLPGSRRFMAPEESTRGAVIDERTTVFNLGRTARVLFTHPDGSWRPGGAAAEVVARACAASPEERYTSVEALERTWKEASGQFLVPRPDR